MTCWEPWPPCIYCGGGRVETFEVVDKREQGRCRDCGFECNRTYQPDSIEAEEEEKDESQGNHERV